MVHGAWKNLSKARRKRTCQNEIQKIFYRPFYSCYRWLLEIVIFWCICEHIYTFLVHFLKISGKNLNVILHFVWKTLRIDSAIRKEWIEWVKLTKRRVSQVTFDNSALMRLFGLWGCPYCIPEEMKAFWLFLPSPDNTRSQPYTVLKLWLRTTQKMFFAHFFRNGGPPGRIPSPYPSNGCSASKDGRFAAEVTWALIGLHFPF